ncbi:MAG: tRNA (N(6)-L-threonylcarbamoyladenosine(37)-C(2))-methylthiotransferase MtaB [Bacilli bacterium]|nr:tRNA (N(6)-L-threonylcarbamoyladenosine(37)-C(2))-methylthiotransferase MtaB [Bacilli bacterium]
MKVAIYTLGCKVNTYESEYIMDQLISKGYELVPFNEYADVYIINTCTVTNVSDSKSMKSIRQAINRNREAIIVVMGCLSQYRFTELKENKNIDILIGNKDKSKIVDYLEAYIKTKEKQYKIYNLTKEQFESMEITNFHNRTRAFVKIQDGCNNYCSYCIIAYVRGSIRSKPKEAVLREIANLVDNGYQEVVLTGIHTGSYGQDLKNYSFEELLADIIKIPNLKRLRISSIEITELTPNILTLLAKSDIIVDHLHIPLQAGCNKILKLMNRKYDTEYFLKKINQIRNIRPNISITTDVIVGFPGETEADFIETYNFIKQVNFAKLHVFPYSKRDNTKAAEMPNQIKEVIKKERVQKLLKLSKELELNYMNKFIGKDLEVLFETNKKDYSIGHTSNYLLVKLDNTKFKSGDLVTVKLDKINYPYINGSL